jgi:hypothetical protein
MRVLISDIDFDDRYYMIGRDHIDQDLLSSIRDFGVLDPPVIMQTGGKFRIVFGFNRLRTLKSLGHDAAPAVVIDKIEPEWYIARALLKSRRNECGPMGRLRMLVILKEAFAIDPERIALIGVKGLHVPEHFIHDAPLLASVMNLPDAVKSYIDRKDIQYKTIRELVDLPRHAVDRIAEWLEAGMIRVNIFKNIVEMLIDICARDGDISRIEIMHSDPSEAGKRWDEYVLNRIFSVRYPVYTGLKAKADEIVRQYSSKGIRIDYPPYFEGDTIELAVTLRKRDDLAIIREKISTLDLSRLRELLDLL